MTRIALIYGGDSSEWEISVLSGKHVASCLDRSKYEVYEILLRGDDWQLCDASVTDRAVPVAPVRHSDFSCEIDGVRVKFDLALIMIHGTPGENGILQAELERLGVPFTTCSSKVAALTFDKYACKKYMRGLGIPLAPDVFLTKGDKWSAEEIVERLGLPVFVKPNDGGSSFGVTKVKLIGELQAAVETAFAEGDNIIIESHIPGRELTEGVYNRGGVIVTLPVTEIVSHNEYFDYEAKYLGKSDEICPAPITPEEEHTVREYTRRIYQHFGCRGLIRCDYIMTEAGHVYFLEINPVPGMTKMSLVPAQIRAAGMTVGEVLDCLIEEALSE
ncbi:MAG: D-alanine--D-alanine ligase [Bacteroidales bacterium]|nr:D-alanine--D-alanine ligase [Bacteroidales bacterium]